MSKRYTETLSYEKCAEMLSHISPDESRNIWVSVGMALHSEYGDRGVAIWKGWSASSQHWNEKECDTAWRNFKSDGGITIGTLVMLAKERGYDGWTVSTVFDPDPDPFVNVPPPPDPFASIDPYWSNEDYNISKRKEVDELLFNAQLAPHPYLKRKKLNFEYPCLGDDLIIPMEDNFGDVRSIQRINSNGNKRFHKGVPANGLRLPISSPHGKGMVVNVEGVADGWSLAALDVGIEVICWFSDINMAKHASKGIVLADNDPAGINAAKKTGLPFAVAHDPHKDVSDMFVAGDFAGINNLVKNAIIAGIQTQTG